jgi:hypothetical protein
VRITVQDLGSDIEPEKHGTLFEAFYSTKPQGHGDGAADQPLHRGGFQLGHERVPPCSRAASTLYGFGRAFL